MIYGNIDGIRRSTLDAMEKWYEWDLDASEFLPEELVGQMSEYTQQFNREIMLYLTRSSEILEITIGSQNNVPLSAKRMFRNPDRLAGVRCIHTHPGGDPNLSVVDEQALRLLKLDAMCAIGVLDGKPTGICAGFLGEMVGERAEIVTHGPVKPNRIPQSVWMDEIERAEQRVSGWAAAQSTDQFKERAVLVSIDSDESLEELQGLAETAGAQVVVKTLQRRAMPDGTTYVGSGKAEELAMLCQAEDAQLLIVDDELTGAQMRNLEEAVGVRVIDRTTLILDIFAQRANAREGKLQVELAQMRYRLPRIMGMGTVLSRLGGGIGTRGPGETKLESDRRRIRKRITDLERELSEVVRQREVRRSRRTKTDQTVVCLVGYTNAGKSTLLNALSGADVLVEDKLFATLDPVTRKVQLPDYGQILLVDTVGFIRKLPHDLVEAFKSTLEEATYADLILLVSDASSEHYEQRREVVLQVLADLGAEDKPRIEVLNKVDLLAEQAPFEPDAVRISASKGEGLEALLGKVTAKLSAKRRKVKLLIPYAQGGLLSTLYENAQVLEQQHTDEGTEVMCILDVAVYQKIAKQLEPHQTETLN